MTLALERPHSTRAHLASNDGEHRNGNAIVGDEVHEVQEHALDRRRQQNQRNRNWLRVVTQTPQCQHRRDRHQGAGYQRHYDRDVAARNTHQARITQRDTLVPQMAQRHDTSTALRTLHGRNA